MKKSEQFCEANMYRSPNNQGASVPVWAEVLQRNAAQRDAAQMDEYLDLEDCKAQGLHLTDCDDDGYCNYCGEQE